MAQIRSGAVTLSYSHATLNLILAVMRVENRRCIAYSAQGTKCVEPTIVDSTDLACSAVWQLSSKCIAVLIDPLI